MLKLKRALRSLAVTCAFAFAGTASAGQYSMQDYYSALVVVENDNAAIAGLEAEIAYDDNQIAWANDFYGWMINLCGSGAGAHGGSNESREYARQECVWGWEMERDMVINSYEADKMAAQTALWTMQMQLGVDLGVLQFIKDDLGIE